MVAIKGKDSAVGAWLENSKPEKERKTYDLHKQLCCSFSSWLTASQFRESPNKKSVCLKPLRLITIFVISTLLLVFHKNVCKDERINQNKVSSVQNVFNPL